MHSKKTTVSWNCSELVLAAALGLLASFLLILPAAAGSVRVEVTVFGDGAPINGATLTLLAGSTVIDATNQSVGGQYELTADPGGYLLSVVPPTGSAFGPTTAPVSVAAPGPTLITVALSSANAPPPDPGEPQIRVSGRLRGGNDALGRRLRVQFSSAQGTYSADTDDRDAEYALLLPAGEYVVRISTGFTVSSLVGWPSVFDLTYTVPVTVQSGEESQRIDLSVPFVPQSVVARTAGGEPAAGVKITATGEDRSLSASIGDAPGIWGLTESRTTNSAGEATLWVLPGTYRMVGLRGTDFAADVILEGVVLPDPELDEFTFEPLVRPEITGRMVDRAGNGIGGGTSGATLRPAGGTGSLSDPVAPDGTFRVPRPEPEGPFELRVSDPGRNSFGTPTYLDARNWRLDAGPFALVGNEDLGDIVVPGIPVQVCTVGRTTGDPVQAFASADAVIEDIPVGSATGSLSFFQSLSFGGLNSDCTRTVVPPGVEITFEVRPNGSGLEQGYIETTTQIIATFDPGDPDQVQQIVLPVDNFADLDQDAAVDVEFQLLNTTGLPIGPISLDLTPTDPTFFRSLFAPDGAVAIRLIRQRHVVTSRSSLPADRASKRGNVSVTLALDATDPLRPGVDLGPIELPYIPVDITVRGVDGVPLSGALINTTTSRQFCAAGTGIVAQVCARSTYDAPFSNFNDRVVTNGFGRARIWLVPASYTLRIGAPSGGSGYQGQDISLSIPGGSQGRAVFANLANSTITPAPIPPLQISAGGPYAAAEGGSIDLTAIVVSGTAEGVTWDLSGNGVFDVPGAQISLDTSSGPDVLPVSVRACDANGTCVVDATSVIVSNVAPLVASAANLAGAGGDELVVSTTFTDPGAGDLHTGSVEVIGSAPVIAVVLSPNTDGPGSVAATITAPSCPTAADCELPVTIRVSDGFASGTTTFVLTVAGTPGGDEPLDELFRDRFEP